MDLVFGVLFINKNGKVLSYFARKVVMNARSNKNGINFQIFILIFLENSL